MSKRMKRKDLSRFALVWIVIIVSVLILWIVGLCVVRALLAEYEAVQPIHAAEQVFDLYFVNGNTDKLLEYSKLQTSPYESVNDAVGYFKSVIGDGELSFEEVISTDETVRMYAVSAGDVTFASFTLADGEEKTELLGLHYPELQKIEVSLKPLCGAVIYAPLGAEVRVNGILLDSSAMEGEAVILKEEPYFPSGAIEARTMVNYAVSRLYAEPTVSVKEAGENGRSMALEKTDSVYSAEYAYRMLLADEYNRTVLAEEERRKAEEEARRQEEQRKEEERKRISDEIVGKYGEFVQNMAKQYNKFIYSLTRAAIQNETKVYFKQGTYYYGYVTKGASGGYYNWGFYYKTIDFTDVVLSDFVWLDEAHTRFKGRVQMTVKMFGYDPESKEWKDDTEYFDMTPYVEVSGKSPLVYDLPTTDADNAAMEEAARKAAEEAAANGEGTN